MKRLLAAVAVVIFAAAFAAPARAEDAPAGPMDLYLLVGQSNMAGRGKPEAQDKVPAPHVWMLTEAETWAPATDPLHFDKPKVAGVGPGRTFGIAVAASTGHEAGLVPCAVGGTSISQWKPGGKLYTDAVRRAKAAMAHGTFKGILWHQGESDIDHRTPEDEYFPQLAEVIAHLRSDLNLPDVPVVVGEVGRYYQKKHAGTDAFNAKLMSFASSEPHCACVSSEGLTPNADNVHFTAASQREFGRRYAAAFSKLTSATK